MRELHAWLLVWGAASGAAAAAVQWVPARGIGFVLGLVVGLSAAFHAGRALQRDRGRASE